MTNRKDVLLRNAQGQRLTKKQLDEQLENIHFGSVEVRVKSMACIRLHDAAQRKRISTLEERLFHMGAMADPPCFRCGYNGPNYFWPATHPCAKRHHQLDTPAQKV